jgi:hypothetical protein
MNIIDRVKNICLTPNTEWPIIASEPSSTGSLISGYVAPLAAIGAVAGLIGGSVVGRSGLFTGTYRLPLTAGLMLACWTFVGAIIGVVVIAFIINALAPTFGGEKNSTQAMKVAVYSFTPAWVAGVLQIIPALGVLGILASLYGLYLLYLGLPVLMKAPGDKAAGYTVVTVICAVVVMVAITAVGGLVMGAGAITAGLLSGATGSPASSSAAEVKYDKDSPLGKLEALGKAMEESNKKMEAAQKSGDPNAAASAAMESLGTLLGGGKRVDPLEIEQIKAFLPPSIAGLTKQGTGSAEKSGMGGFMISKAQANYTDGGSKSVTVEISDPGGATGLVGLASWASLQTTKEDEYGSERTSKINGRMVHEKTSKNGEDEYQIVIGERFVVSANSRDVKVDQLRAIVSSLDLNKLESMKDVGVKK